MIREELKVGSVYWVNHSGGKVKARLDTIIDSPGFHSIYRKSRKTTTYLMTKLSTGRQIRFRSAVKIKGAITDV